MDDGQVAEFGPPDELAYQEDSTFAGVSERMR